MQKNHLTHQKSHNKLLKVAHYVRWTAVHLHMCGFAAQNSTTHMQTHSRPLAKRWRGGKNKKHRQIDSV